MKAWLKYKLSKLLLRPAKGRYCDWCWRYTPDKRTYLFLGGQQRSICSECVEAEPWRGWKGERRIDIDSIIEEMQST